MHKLERFYNVQCHYGKRLKNEILHICFFNAINFQGKTDFKNHTTYGKKLVIQRNLHEISNLSIIKRNDLLYKYALTEKKSHHQEKMFVE